MMALSIRTSTGEATRAEPITLDEYLSLPDDVPYEIVDGALRQMVRSSKKGREVQSILNEQIRSQKPRGLRVAEEEVVVLHDVPAIARIPDVVVFHGDVDPDGESNHTASGDVFLVVEIVSPSSQTADRYEKPAEYARAGIPSFWRIELDPSISVHVYNLFEDVYRDEGVYRRGGLIKDPTLPWLEIEVNDLLGDYA